MNLRVEFSADKDVGDIAVVASSPKPIPNMEGSFVVLDLDVFSSAPERINDYSEWVVRAHDFLYYQVFEKLINKKLLTAMKGDINVAHR